MTRIEKHEPLTTNEWEGIFCLVMIVLLYIMISFVIYLHPDGTWYQKLGVWLLCTGGAVGAFWETITYDGSSDGNY